MGRGNDAIPTWSGFNYQGKMMLLYVLELINQIVKDQNKDIDAYSVELEKTEDFCIICDSEYKSFHQVKAYLSKDKWNSYSEAMDKLLKHRAESNNPTAKCYLTVAKEIKDWDDAIPVLKVFLEENTILIKMDDTLSGCKALSVDKLQQLLDKVKISEFKSQGIEKFDIEEFSQQYESLLKELQEKEVPNKIIFQEKQVELYKSIHNTYYHNEKPYHTVGELQSKEQYVAKLFNDNLSLQLSTEETRLKELKRDYEKYKKKTEDMTDAVKILISKYEDANKEYQTQLLNAIKIPLMVYSGRIIQNYPLGLGIRAIIKTNQLVFEAASKSGSDVYNILSTGQLNGLSIALLLSIKNVYGDTKGLNILLIDDPLQTIDDISAISLADLLTQQGIGQIVLSTHEEAKAALLRYKFKHAGMSVREQNMQALYMKTVTEE